MSDATHLLHRETKAAESLKADLLALTDDTETLRDTIEGETSLHDLIRAVLVSIEDDEVMVDGCASRIKDLQDRKARFDQRIESKRALIERAMMVGEIDKIETDIATLSLTRRAPKPIILDEASIPSEFWEPQPPRLDKKALASALKDGREVPGVTLDNATVSLTLRRK